MCVPTHVSHCAPLSLPKKTETAHSARRPTHYSHDPPAVAAPASRCSAAAAPRLIVQYRRSPSPPARHRGSRTHVPHSNFLAPDPISPKQNHHHRPWRRAVEDEHKVWRAGGCGARAACGGRVPVWRRRGDTPAGYRGGRGLAPASSHEGSFRNQATRKANTRRCSWRTSLFLVHSGCDLFSQDLSMIH